MRVLELFIKTVLGNGNDIYRIKPLPGVTAAEFSGARLQPCGRFFSLCATSEIKAPPSFILTSVVSDNHRLL